MFFFPKGHSWQLTWGEARKGVQKKKVAVLGGKSPLKILTTVIHHHLEKIANFVLVVQDSKNLEANQSRIDVVWGYC